MGHKRYLTKSIQTDLKEKMVFIGGPRQVGKTTLAIDLLPEGHEEHPAYLNWDFPESRKDLLAGNIPASEKLLILDEIHKYKNWRNLIKGLYDRYKKNKSFLITGSAKLDYYRRGGDSLQGRYYYYRLHPFSLGELKANKYDIEHLLTFGGFPEPCTKGDTKFWRRWHRERLKRVINDDLINLENVKEINQMDMLAHALPDRVGSPLSVKNISEDLYISHKTAERWLQILENLYVCYRIPPYGPPKIRAVKKEQKLYLWDWSVCPNKGARFENMVASHLLKYCHYVEDTEGYDMELRFIRDVDKREIDFVVLQDTSPLFAVECKSGEKSISRHINYYSQRTKIPIFYQVHLGTRDYENTEYRARVLPFEKFVSVLKLP